MVRTIDQSSFDIDSLIARNDTVLHSFFNTCFNRSNVFFRYSTADDFTFEDKARTWFKRLQSNDRMTVLTATAGLTDKFALCLDSFADGLFVRNLRFTNLSLYLEFTFQTVNDNIQVQLAHAGDNGLSGFMIGISTESRILLS